MPILAVACGLRKYLRRPLATLCAAYSAYVRLICFSKWPHSSSCVSKSGRRRPFVICRTNLKINTNTKMEMIRIMNVETKTKMKNEIEKREWKNEPWKYLTFWNNFSFGGMNDFPVRMSSLSRTAPYFAFSRDFAGPFFFIQVYHARLTKLLERSAGGDGGGRDGSASSSVAAAASSLPSARDKAAMDAIAEALDCRASRCAQGGMHTVQGGTLKYLLLILIPSRLPTHS